MTPRRFALLFVAPVLIVIASMMLTRICRYPLGGQVAANEVDSHPVELLTEPSSDASIFDGMESACLSSSLALKGQLGSECSVVVHPPFVIGGDMTPQELNRWYRRTIRPTSIAMQDEYFVTQPDEPIRLLLFKNAESYEQYGHSLFGDRYLSVYGYFRPAERTLLVNVGTGSGSLVHELTHALMEDDFPTAPPWLQEGLASLHEHATVIRDADQHRLRGKLNWRLHRLQTAMAHGQLEPIQSILTTDSLRNHQEPLNYACARYLCLYLQENDLLGTFYHAFRDHGVQTDPTGRETLKSLLGEARFASLDRDYKRWIGELSAEGL